MTEAYAAVGTEHADDKCDWQLSGIIICNLGELERIFDLFYDSQ